MAVLLAMGTTVAGGDSGGGGGGGGGGDEYEGSWFCTAAECVT
jgi:hypothetical protein